MSPMRELNVNRRSIAAAIALAVPLVSGSAFAQDKEKEKEHKDVPPAEIRYQVAADESAGSAHDDEVISISLHTISIGVSW